MDQEILSSLYSIKTLLYFFVTISAANLCLGALRFGFGIRNDMRETSGKVFQMMVDDYLATNKLDELVRHCDEQLAKRPNDAYALWYLGKARFIQKDFHAARLVLSKLLEIEPTWTKSHVQPMLDAIAAAESRGSETAANPV